MRQNNENKILELFYEYPERKFRVREISRLTGVPRATSHRILLDLKEKKMVTKENIAETSLPFRTKKINYFIEKIIESGLIEELIKKLNPSCIILFGSIRKGDSVKESDIDLFVESSVKKEINLQKYEKKLKHKIQLFVKSNIKKLQPNLFNNVVNGIKLYGGFKIE